MPYSQEKSKEMQLLAEEVGYDEAARQLGISKETLKRSIRFVRGKVGEDFSVNRQKLIDRLSGLSDKELENLVNGAKYKPSKTKEINFDGETVKFLATGDWHVGSSYFDDELAEESFEVARNEGCQFMVNTGDVFEGMSGRPGQIYELEDIGYSKQRDHTRKLFKSWELPIYMVGGNHSNWINSKAGMGIDVEEDLCSENPDWHYLGMHEGDLVINGVTLKLWHGEDGSSYAMSYRIQKIIEAFTGGEKPNALFCGHTHKSMYLFDRNVHALSTGCLQRQSGFMRMKKLAAHVGFWIVEMTIGDGEIKRFTPTWFPYYR